MDRLFKAWQEKQRLSGGQLLAQGNVAYRLNDEHLFVSIIPPSDGMVYEFSYGEERKGWLSNSHCLFPYQQKMNTVSIRAKDLYGNVSRAIAVPVLTQAPEEVLPSISSPAFDFTKDSSLPFWDGLSASALLDSTSTRTQYADGIWTLGSKDTKWGNAAFAGPFLFKELEGDFTAEVLVEDVAGLVGRTRTSSESGIMIQDKDNPMAYLNNTILTGWNLGNLTRNAGVRTHQEGNTGQGLDFDPYLQIQKIGELFYLRSSRDGHNWNHLPNSPFKRPDLAGKKLKTGIYQTANNNQYGYGKFRGFRIWKVR